MENIWRREGRKRVYRSKRLCATLCVLLSLRQTDNNQPANFFSINFISVFHVAYLE
jgi:hypothetical protein